MRQKAAPSAMISKIIEIAFPEGACAMMSVSQVEHCLKHILEERADVLAHDLRHTFAKSLLDPAAYGLDRPPMPLPAIQQLLGHADIATTTIYTRVSADDLARMMGTSEAL